MNRLTHCAVATLAAVLSGIIANSPSLAQQTAVADAVPHFNLEPTCRGIAQQRGLSLEPNQNFQQSFVSCMKSEMAVRRRLVKQWSTFRASDRANCIGESDAGGLASYSDLLTCLQMAKSARRMGY